MEKEVFTKKVGNREFLVIGDFIIPIDLISHIDLSHDNVSGKIPLICFVDEIGSRELKIYDPMLLKSLRAFFQSP